MLTPSELASMEVCEFISPPCHYRVVAFDGFPLRDGGRRPHRVQRRDEDGEWKDVDCTGNISYTTNDYSFTKAWMKAVEWEHQLTENP